MAALTDLARGGSCAGRGEKVAPQATVPYVLVCHLPLLQFLHASLTSKLRTANSCTARLVTGSSKSLHNSPILTCPDSGDSSHLSTCPSWYTNLCLSVEYIDSVLQSGQIKFICRCFLRLEDVIIYITDWSPMEYAYK